MTPRLDWPTVVAVMALACLCLLLALRAVSEMLELAAEGADLARENRTLWAAIGLIVRERGATERPRPASCD